MDKNSIEFNVNEKDNTLTIKETIKSNVTNYENILEYITLYFSCEKYFISYSEEYPPEICLKCNNFTLIENFHPNKLIRKTEISIYYETGNYKGEKDCNIAEINFFEDGLLISIWYRNKGKFYDLLSKLENNNVKNEIDIELRLPSNKCGFYKRNVYNAEYTLLKVLLEEHKTLLLKDNPELIDKFHFLGDNKWHEENEIDIEITSCYETNNYSNKQIKNYNSDLVSKLNDIHYTLGLILDNQATEKTSNKNHTELFRINENTRSNVHNTDVILNSLKNIIYVLFMILMFLCLSLTKY